MPTVAQMQWLVRPLRRLAVRDIHLDPEGGDLRSILLEHPRMVVASNHGGTFGPLAALAGFVTLVEDLGFRDRQYFGVAWRGFYRYPGLRQMATYISQMDRPHGLEDYADMLARGKYGDFLVMPEGDNCNFGDGYAIQPFLSDGFIEIALRANVPILVATHQGSERWSHVWDVPASRHGLFRWMSPRWQQRLSETETLSITNPLRGRIERLGMGFQVYRPELTLDDLATDRSTRRAQLRREGEIVQGIMQASIDRLRVA